jgi:hypothetical protein
VETFDPLAILPMSSRILKDSLVLGNSDWSNDKLSKTFWFGIPKSTAKATTLLLRFFSSSVSRTP